jgi:hypothetical protein
MGFDHRTWRFYHQKKWWSWFEKNRDQISVFLLVKSIV